MEKSSSKYCGYRGEHSYDFKCHFIIHLDLRHGAPLEAPLEFLCYGLRLGIFLSPVSARSSLVLSVSK